MSPDEDYRDLAANARDAVGALIRGSEMGKGAIRLNQMYAELDEVVERYTGTVVSQRDDGGPPPYNAPRSVNTSWLSLDQAVRERLVLDAIGTEARSQRSIHARVEDALPEGLSARSLRVHYVYTALKRLMEAGEIDRRPGPVQKGRRIWLYFRRTELSGPIAEIADQLRDEE